MLIIGIKEKIVGKGVFYFLESVRGSLIDGSSWFLG